MIYKIIMSSDESQIVFIIDQVLQSFTDKLFIDLETVISDDTIQVTTDNFEPMIGK